MSPSTEPARVVRFVLKGRVGGSLNPVPGFDNIQGDVTIPEDVLPDKFNFFIETDPTNVAKVDIYLDGSKDRSERKSEPTIFQGQFANVGQNLNTWVEGYSVLVTAVPFFLVDGVEIEGYSLTSRITVT
jgi:hypothetical protein